MPKYFWGLFSLLCGCASNGIHTKIYTDICIKPLDGYTYKTCQNIFFTVRNKNFFINHGFETDLASIPRIAWPLMAPAHSSLIRPAVIHDYFYRENHFYTRKEADLIFYHMLRNEGVSGYRSSIIYCAVRLFGWMNYKRSLNYGR